MKRTGNDILTGTKWCFIRTGATARNLEFSITIDEASDLLVAQDWKCKLTGLPLTDKTASLDRIDSSKGYVTGNIQWLHPDINIMKSDHEEGGFIELCRLVAEHNTRKVAA